MYISTIYIYKFVTFQSLFLRILQFCSELHVIPFCDHVQEKVTTSNNSRQDSEKQYKSVVEMTAIFCMLPFPNNLDLCRECVVEK